MIGFKQMFVDYLEDQARWRQEKAEDYPEDTRNQRCADGLREFAAYVASLPNDDVRLIRLAAWHKLYDTDMFMPGEYTSHTISRFRFHGDGPQSFEDLLDALGRSMAEDCWEDAVTLLRRDGVF